MISQAKEQNMIHIHCFTYFEKYICLISFYLSSEGKSRPCYFILAENRNSCGFWSVLAEPYCDDAEKIIKEETHRVLFLNSKFCLPSRTCFRLSSEPSGRCFSILYTVSDCYFQEVGLLSDDNKVYLFWKKAFYLILKHYPYQYCQPM